MIGQSSSHNSNSSKTRLTVKQPIRSTLNQDYQRFQQNISQRTSARENHLRQSAAGLNQTSHTINNSAALARPTSAVHTQMSLIGNKENKPINAVAGTTRALRNQPLLATTHD